MCCIGDNLGCHTQHTHTPTRWRHNKTESYCLDHVSRRKNTVIPLKVVVCRSSRCYYVYLYRVRFDVVADVGIACHYCRTSLHLSHR